jgi:hypothetical protein
MVSRCFSQYDSPKLVNERGGAPGSDSHRPLLDGLQAKAVSLLVVNCFGSLPDRFERVPVRPDFEKRIPRDCQVAIKPFPVVQLDDCLTGNELALRGVNAQIEPCSP